jgi:anthranilate synthase component I
LFFRAAAPSIPGTAAFVFQEVFMSLSVTEAVTVSRTIPGDRFTPFGLARKLKARALLESASFRGGRERYSILVLQEAFSIVETADGVFLEKGGRRQKIRNAGRDVLAVLAYFAAQHDGSRFSFPFPAGGTGYLSYEYAARFDTVRLSIKSDPVGVPLASFLFGHVILIFDHYTDMITILGVNYREAEIDLERAVRETEERINDLDFNYLSPSPVDGRAILVPGAPREEYMDGVRKVKQEIVKGNLLQGVLSRRLTFRTAIPAMEAYRSLRSVNPSPYMFYLDFGAFQLFGASPEVHVKVKEGTAVMRPIAGTRRRGATEAEDRRLEAELLADEKERAEHLMLVDLARNDLGRICTPGSVRVTESMVVERYSHVMHIVSQVEGRLPDGVSGIDAIRATFPAGTVSGAPKIRAMEVIDSLERETRGFYAGIVGYLEPGGSLDTCIAIRSALRTGDKLVVQAGAGIVYDSVPEREYEETSAKLGALGKALGVEV